MGLIKKRNLRKFWREDIWFGWELRRFMVNSKVVCGWSEGGGDERGRRDIKYGEVVGI